VPGDPTINDHLGDALWKAGRHIDARFQWNHALTFSDSDTDKVSIEKKLKDGLG
jgi:predicted negative regulator of RcsB-dependent stress response